MRVYPTFDERYRELLAVELLLHVWVTNPRIGLAYLLA